MFKCHLFHFLALLTGTGGEQAVGHSVELHEVTVWTEGTVMTLQLLWRVWEGPAVSPVMQSCRRRTKTSFSMNSFLFLSFQNPRTKVFVLDNTSVQTCPPNVLVSFLCLFSLWPESTCQVFLDLYKNPHKLYKDWSTWCIFAAFFIKLPLFEVNNVLRTDDFLSVATLKIDFLTVSSTVYSMNYYCYCYQ